MRNYKTLLITGCAGFIGSHFTREALRRGYHVIGVDNLSYAANNHVIEEFDENPNFVFVEKDINDLQSIDYRIDLVINFAAETHVDNSIESCAPFIHSNIDGVHHLLELIKKADIPLIQISTDEVYGDIEEGAHTEKDPLHPSNPYAATKASADLLIKSYSRTFDIEYKIIRLTNNYGPDQHEEKLIPKTISYLKQGKKIPLHNNGTPFRNWLHVSDSVEAIFTVILSGNMNEIYNVNGNCELQNIEVIEKILHNFGYFPSSFQDLEYEEYYKIINKYCDFSYSRPGQDIRYHLDDTKLQELGWSPKADFQEEIEILVALSLENA